MEFTGVDEHITEELTLALREDVGSEIGTRVEELPTGASSGTEFIFSDIGGIFIGVVPVDGGSCVYVYVPDSTLLMSESPESEPEKSAFLAQYDIEPVLSQLQNTIIHAIPELTYVPEFERYLVVGPGIYYVCPVSTE